MRRLTAKDLWDLPLIAWVPAIPHLTAALFIATLTACSEHAKQELGLERAELGIQPAIAAQTGLQADPGTPKGYDTIVMGSSPVTEQALTRLLYLAWPQSGEAINSVLGPPVGRTDDADFYEIAGSGRVLTIFYTGNIAYGYAVEESW